jgi:hypothetical protein
MNTDTGPDARITMICPNLSCRRTLSAPVSARGKLMRCAYCDVPFRVPKDTGLRSEAAPAGHEGQSG